MKYCFQILAALVVTSMLACTPDETSLDVGTDVDVPIDAPEDTSAPDVPSEDVPTDVAVDTASDSGPDDPEWEALPGLPEGCTIERANHPERLVRNEWIECGEGCTYLARDERFQRAVASTSGWHDGERGYFSLIQGLLSEPESTRRRITVVLDTDGQVYGAWRDPLRVPEEVCQVAGPILGDGQLVLFVRVLNGNGRRTAVWYAPLGSEAFRGPPLVVLDEEVIRGAALQNGSVSNRIFATELQPGGRLLLIAPNGEWQKYEVPGGIQRPQAISDDVYLEGIGSPFRRILRVRFGEEPEVVVEEATAHATGLAVDQTTLSWQIASGGDRLSRAERIDLWASPIPTSDTTLAPRWVRNLTPELHSNYAPSFGDKGFVARQFPGTFVRLSDGATSAWPLNGDHGVAGNDGFLWISEGDVATAAVSTRAAPAFGTVVRTQIDSLRSL